MLGLDDDDDIDIFSKDESLMNFYQEQNGPENETIYQFYTRSYQKLCNRIIAPERFKYDPKVDIGLEGYNHNEYDVYARGRTLHMCHWQPIISKNKSNGSDMAFSSVIDDEIAQKEFSREEVEDEETKNALCIVYFHTNMRSLVDAKEIAPIARSLGAHLISYDLPGCGKSEGQLGGNLDLDMEIILDWVQALIDPSVRIILWSRGMSTAPLVSLLRRFCIAKFQQESLVGFSTPQESSKSLRSVPSNNSNNNCSTSTSSKKSTQQPKTMHDFHIIASVLDSPFTSIEDMVQHGLEQFQGRGFSFTKSLLSFLIHRTLTHISKQLQGFNLFSVRPIDDVGDIYCPVCIISASCDDYVPVQHGQQIAAAWGSRAFCASINVSAAEALNLSQQRQASVEFHIYEDVTCKHFDPRPSHVVYTVESFLRKQVASAAEFEATTPFACHLASSATPNSVSSCSVTTLATEGAAISEAEIIDLAEFENIANAIDAEVAFKQQEQQQFASTGGPAPSSSSATKLSFSSSSSSLQTMATSLRQSSWWSFSGRFSSSNIASSDAIGESKSSK
jgi:hypothetical protein